MILVVGDFMIDEYVHVAIDRISPEAPVPVMRELDRDYMPGGAGNVAANIATMGDDVKLLAVIGNDIDAKWWNPFTSAFPWIGWIKDSKRHTTIKTRFIAERGQQVARLDRESHNDIDMQMVARLNDNIKLDGVSVVVISDYGKGVVTPSLARLIIDNSRARGIPTIVNSKRDSFYIFHGATIITCNAREYGESENRIPVGTIGIVTHGEDGIRIHGLPGHVRKIDGIPVEVGDVTGAGDTVVAGLACWIKRTGVRANGAPKDIIGAAQFANRAASVAVRHRGTHAVRSDEF